MARQKQLACPFCGKSTLLDRVDLDRLGDNWSIDWKVLQIRDMLAGPGRGHRGKSKDYGFPVIKEESLSIVDLAADPSYAEVVAAVKQRLITIVRAYVEAGIIRKEELV